MKKKKLSSSSTIDFHLPDECWESIFTFIFNDNNLHYYLESLSLVSKQFLSITNTFKFSLKINGNPSRLLLRHLFQRFTNLISLDLTRFNGNLHALLFQISRFENKIFNLKSLKISDQSEIPANGLRALSKKIKTLTSLACCNIETLSNNDLVLISDCFPLLEELDLSNSMSFGFENVELNATSFALPKLRKVNLSGHYYINDSFLLQLFKNCEFLEEMIVVDVVDYYNEYIFYHGSLITYDGIADAISERPGLRSLSFSKMGMFGNHDISPYFIESLVSLKGLTSLDLSYSFVSDELLSSIAEEGVLLRRLVLQGCYGYSFDAIFNLVAKRQFFQHLDFQCASFLNDRCVTELSVYLSDLVFINISKCANLTNVALFALVRNCPLLSEIKMEGTSIGKIEKDDSNPLMNVVVINPQVKSLRLAHNSCLRDESIIMFASIFPNLQLLDLSYCSGISKIGIDQVLRKCSKIRHLNLSASGIDDELLNVISECCFGLLQLDLGRCIGVTEKGVRQVLESCTQLREINLKGCIKVTADVVDAMLCIRPSLRKVTAPPSYRGSESKRKLFSRHGCLVC